jgi:hypothetical protein
MKDVQQLVVNQLGVANGLNNSLADGQVTPDKMSAGAPFWHSDGSIFTSGARIEINPFLVGDDDAYIDFHSTSASEPSFDARIHKKPGENSNFQLENKGTGSTVIYQNDEAKFVTQGGTEGFTKLYAGGGSSSSGANIELYGSTHTTDANKAFYDANRHRFRSAAGGTNPYVDMNMTDGGGAELVVGSTDTNGKATLKLSSFTPSIIFEDRTTSTADFQLTANAGVLRVFSGDNTNGDAQLPNEALSISSTGHVYVPNGNFHVGTSNASMDDGVILYNSGVIYLNKGNTDSATQLRFYRNNTQVGSITTNGSTTSFNTSSDYRLKTDAQPMVDASARVQALNPVNFEWISSGERVDGFLAHEAQEVVPEAVHGTKDALDEEGNPEYQGIDQSKLVPLLTKALQEALTKIEALEVRITALEA